eukprot:7068754-Pyramimonas_sp.AAC.2
MVQTIYYVFALANLERTINPTAKSCNKSLIVGGCARLRPGKMSYGRQLGGSLGFGAEAPSPDTFRVLSPNLRCLFVFHLHLTF